ncbi:MAG: hypothetical protein Q4B48_03750 [Syntrophomonadaceae bacterium]|nr:hypothetical protein [Syntrophomonadaceae bacterium]
MLKNIENANKVYVEAIVRYDPEGGIHPLAITWEDGSRWAIDKVIDIRPQASRKAGGAGICYTIKIGRHQRQVYLEEGRWFIERKMS